MTLPLIDTTLQLLVHPETGNDALTTSNVISVSQIERGGQTMPKACINLCARTSHTTNHSRSQRRYTWSLLVDDLGLASLLHRSVVDAWPSSHQAIIVCISERTRCSQGILIELDRKSAERWAFACRGYVYQRPSQETQCAQTQQPFMAPPVHNSSMLIQSLHPIVLFPLATLKACVEQSNPISATRNRLRTVLSPCFDNKYTRVGLEQLPLQNGTVFDVQSFRRSRRIPHEGHTVIDTAARTVLINFWNGTKYALGRRATYL
jgi:hypothetical protein